jgi:biopolymer transport protein ExbD
MRAVPPRTEHAVSHPAEEADAVLGIDAAGAFYLNKQPIARDQLAGALRSIYTGRMKDRVLYVRADRSTSYALVLEALDVAAKNGVVVVGMISEQRPKPVDAPSGP